MKVEVQLFATLAPYLPPGGEPAFVDVAPDATVTDLIRALAIPDAMPRIVLVNGRDADDTERLRPGDVVSVFPPLAGGGDAGRGDGEASANPSVPRNVTGGFSFLWCPATSVEIRGSSVAAGTLAGTLGMGVRIGYPRTATERQPTSSTAPSG